MSRIKLYTHTSVGVLDMNVFSVFMGNCLSISQTCLSCLPSGRISPTCVLCPLMIGLMRNDGSVDVFCMVSMVLVMWEVAAILGNSCGIQGQNYVAWLQESKMPVGFYYKNLI